MSQRHSGSSKQRPSRREKRVLNPKFTEISGEMGQKGGKGKMQGEEITEEEDLDGELKAELSSFGKLGETSGFPPAKGKN